MDSPLLTYVGTQANWLAQHPMAAVGAHHRTRVGHWFLYWGKLYGVAQICAGTNLSTQIGPVWPGTGVRIWPSSQFHSLSSSLFQPLLPSHHHQCGEASILARLGQYWSQLTWLAPVCDWISIPPPPTAPIPFVLPEMCFNGTFATALGQRK